MRKFRWRRQLPEAECLSPSRVEPVDAAECQTKGQVVGIAVEGRIRHARNDRGTNKDLSLLASRFLPRGDHLRRNA